MKLRKEVIVLVVAIVALTFLPYIEAVAVTGQSWSGVIPTFSDELNFARLNTIGEGHLTDGNAYYFEHDSGPPLVIFGGAWLNAIPLWLGVPYNATLQLNFIVWSILFALSLYWLLRLLRVKPWLAVFGTLFIFIESFTHAWRPVNMQPVYPFYFLLFAALIRFLRAQNRTTVWQLGLFTGISFYLYAYLWQVAVIMLGFLFLYSLVLKKWPLAKATVFAGVIGGVIGCPVPLYALYLSHTYADFWPSVYRLGLVNTHLPTSEVIYSGGWIGIISALIIFIFWRAKTLRADAEFGTLGFFLLLSGLSLWVMESSNLVTGKWLETGEHVRILILPWLAVATLSLGAALWKRRTELAPRLRQLSYAGMALLMVGNLYFAWNNFSPYLFPEGNRDLWTTEQQYTPLLNWLNTKGDPSAVVWVDPHDYLSAMLPALTKDFVLDNYWGMLELAPESEIRERYLVSQYFNNPSKQVIESDSEINLYLGRHDDPHEAKTVARQIAICKIIFFWKKQKNCGTPPTPQSLLGDAFFANMETELQTDIRPNIKTYLAKYHVKYIVKDKVLDPAYRPEALGAKLLYSDQRYELYQL